MNTSFQFGRSYREWWFVGLIIAAIALAAGGSSLAIVRHEAASRVLVGAAVVAISAVMSAVLIARSRFELQVKPTGFLIRDRAGEREFNDSQMICAGLSQRQHFSNGLLASTTRTFELWLEGAETAEQVALKTRLPTGVVDPLTDFIDRIQSDLYERATEALQSRESFEGESWTLNERELIVRSGGNPEAVDLADLSAVEIYDDELCVWRYNQDTPVFRIPMGSANTRILQRLLLERIPPRPSTAGAVSGLGRILFERKPDRLIRAVAWSMPALLVPLAGGAIAFALLANYALFLICMLPFCLILLVWLLAMLQMVKLRAYEHGVWHKTPLRTSQMWYRDVDAFSYSVVQHFHNGAYSATYYTLTFASARGGRRQKVKFTATLRKEDFELEHLRDRVSALIADRMWNQFAQRQAVAWTDHLRFLPEGLEFRPTSLFGRKPPVLIPYSQICGCDSDYGVFCLWVHGQKKPAARENVSKPNFFPGYHLLGRILASAAAGIETATTE